MPSVEKNHITGPCFFLSYRWELVVPEPPPLNCILKNWHKFDPQSLKTPFILAFSAVREDLTSPKRQSLLGQHLINQSTPFIRANLNTLWFKNFSYETMTTKRKDDIFDTEWPWYPLDSRENLLKWNLFEITKLVLFARAIRKKLACWNTILELWSCLRNKNRPGKKPKVNSYHILGIHNPLYLGLQP